MQFAWLLPSLLVGAYWGATTGTWQMLIMSAATALGWLLARAVSQHRALEPDQPVVFASDSVWIGDYRLPRYEIFWKREWHDLVYRAYVDQNSTPNFKMPFDLTSGHTLIVGPTGAGKSELLKSIVSDYLSREGIELALFDFKGGATFGRLANHISGKVRMVVTDIDQIDHLPIWRQIENELARREAILAKYGCSRIEDYRANDLPRLVVVIDELATALAESSAAISALNSIASRGRTLGLHMVAASQSVQGITRSMLVNLKSRVLLGEPDPIDVAQLNVKRPSSRPAGRPGWFVGLAQNPDTESAYFFYPVGVILGF